MSYFIKYCLLLAYLTTLVSCAQNKQYPNQDILRGSITKERSWWDLSHYKLDLKINIKNRYISGSNTIDYTVLKPYQTLQIDLQTPLKITKVTQDSKNLSFTTVGYANFINLEKEQKVDAKNSIVVYYEGNPVESKRPPWSGGFTWEKDQENNPFVATSCQGIGASIWWPCKDHMYDEPEQGADIIVTTPKGVTDVSNGRLISSTENKDGTSTQHWQVVNPINNYGINVNIANYVHFSEVYKGINGNLDCDYYVLPYHLEKAKKQFKQVPKMLEAFEHWFGPYPFYKDGYKLVEVPYLGMEHQSSVTYGNRFENGYLGRDLSGTGWGLKFDFIIIHESGHEWFANNITYKDAADMWIHEGFTAYSETLYVDYYFGSKAGNEYVIGTRKSIQNDRPIIGTYNVNKQGSSDMYYKGANMIHTYRQLVNDDEKFRNILRGLNKTFYHQTVTTSEIENYLAEKVALDLTGFFNQYLRSTKIPKLEIELKKHTFKYRWTNIVANFKMPIKVIVDGKNQWITPSNDWQTMQTKSKQPTVTVDDNFYIQH